MDKKERIFTKRGFLNHTLYSQTASVIALTSFNFLDVIKIRLIKDIHKCSKDHFR